MVEANLMTLVAKTRGAQATSLFCDLEDQTLLSPPNLHSGLPKIPSWNFSHFPKEDSSTRGAKKDISRVYGGYNSIILEEKMAPGWSPGSFLGDLRPGERSGVL
eukprot:1148898-Pelagomonas_calceolata.AAC.5